MTFLTLGVGVGFMAASGMADEPGDPATWHDGVAVFGIVAAVGVPGFLLGFVLRWINSCPSPNDPR